MIQAIGIICGLAIIDKLTEPEGITGKKVLYESKFFRPYKDSKTTLPNKYYNKAGVYVIKSNKTEK